MAPEAPGLGSRGLGLGKTKIGAESWCAQAAVPGGLAAYESPRSRSWSPAPRPGAEAGGVGAFVAALIDSGAGRSVGRTVAAPRTRSRSPAHHRGAYPGPPAPN